MDSVGIHIPSLQRLSVPPVSWRDIDLESIFICKLLAIGCWGLSLFFPICLDLLPFVRSTDP
jgi:hypothetical protein